MAVVSWRELNRAGTVSLSSDDLLALEALSGEPPETLEELLESDDKQALDYTAALLKVLENVTDVDMVSQVLDSIGVLFDVPDPTLLASRIALFRDRKDPASPACVTPLLRWLTSAGNVPVVQRAATCVGTLLSVSPANTTAAEQVVLWVAQTLRTHGSAAAMGGGGRSDGAAGAGGGAAADGDASDVDERQVFVGAATSCLMTLVRNIDFNDLLLENQIVESLVPVLATRNTQLLYQSAFSLWILSLSGPFCSVMDRVGAVLGLCGACGLDYPVKITRVAVAALVNIAKHKPCAETALATMSETQLPAVLLQVAERADIHDEELNADCSELSDLLQHNLRVLTSMERYEREVESGVLRWSAVHTTEFWRENCRKLDANNFKLIRTLSGILETSSDANTLAVACYDIGEFGVHHPHGRTIVDKLHLKDSVMRLLQREDAELKRHALLCCSKLMVKRYSFMTTSK